MIFEEAADHPLQGSEERGLRKLDQTEINLGKILRPSAK